MPWWRRAGASNHVSIFGYLLLYFMCASLCYNSVGMTALKIVYVYVSILSLWNIADAGTFYRNTSRVTTVYCNYVWRHAGVPGQVN